MSEALQRQQILRNAHSALLRVAARLTSGAVPQARPSHRSHASTATQSTLKPAEEPAAAWEGSSARIKGSTPAPTRGGSGIQRPSAGPGTAAVGGAGGAESMAGGGGWHPDVRLRLLPAVHVVLMWLASQSSQSFGCAALRPLLCERDTPPPPSFLWAGAGRWAQCG